MTDKFKIELCSPSDREQLVAAVMIDGQQWAEINQEPGALTVEFYPRKDGTPWIFDFEDAIGGLLSASKQLLGTK